MKYNFDEVIDRRNSDSTKWGNLEELYGNKDILPMWIADMDFRSAEEIIQAMRDRVEHGIFGYVHRSDSFSNAIINWVKKKHGWEIKKEWILYLPGVVMGLNIGVRELIGKGNKVLVQPPVYPPFYRVIENNSRIANNNPLRHNGKKYVMDYENLE